MKGEFFIISRIVGEKLASVFNNPNDKILDIGCGKNPKYHESVKGKIVCFDVYKTASSTIVGDADELYKYFKPKSFDKVISVNSFYYFKNPFNVAKYASRILKSRGKFVMVAPFFYPVHDVPEDKFRFTEYGIKNILGKYFVIDEIKALGGIFNIPAVLAHSLIKGIPLLFSGKLRAAVKIVMLVFYPLYVVLQLFSLLDFLDKTRRFPTYYFVVASKK